jgi:predicted DNA-binding transcriptional regulator YafY
LVFDPTVAEIVTETNWHHTQSAQRQSDGSVLLSFNIDGLNEIVRWIVGWAGQVKVQSPEELRRLVVEKHRKAMEVNDGLG